MIIFFRKRVIVDGLLHKPGSSAIVDDDKARMFIKRRIGHEWIPNFRIRHYRCRLVSLRSGTSETTHSYLGGNNVTAT